MALLKYTARTAEVKHDDVSALAATAGTHPAAARGGNWSLRWRWWRHRCCTDGRRRTAASDRDAGSSAAAYNWIQHDSQGFNRINWIATHFPCYDVRAKFVWCSVTWRLRDVAVFDGKPSHSNSDVLVWCGIGACAYRPLQFDARAKRYMADGTCTDDGYQLRPEAGRNTSRDWITARGRDTGGWGSGAERVGGRGGGERWRGGGTHEAVDGTVRTSAWKSRHHVLPFILRPRL